MRKQVMKCFMMLAVIGLMGMCAGTGCKTSAPAAHLRNECFYGADGAFAPSAAREAYFEMFRALGYPISPKLRTDAFWVCDFKDRGFTKIGVGGIFWMNVSGAYPKETKPISERYGYCGLELFLLPGQMIPEHNHAGPAQGHDAKMEGWFIRYGSVTFYYDRKPDESWKPIAELPKDQQPPGFDQPWFRCSHYVRKEAGDTLLMDVPAAWHCQQAGPNGAIVSEYATFHNSVGFSKPGMAFEGSGPRN